MSEQQVLQSRWVRTLISGMQALEKAHGTSRIVAGCIHQIHAPVISLALVVATIMKQEQPRSQARDVAQRPTFAPQYAGSQAVQDALFERLDRVPVYHVADFMAGYEPHLVFVLSEIQQSAQQIDMAIGGREGVDHVRVDDLESILYLLTSRLGDQSLADSVDPRVQERIVVNPVLLFNRRCSLVSQRALDVILFAATDADDHCRQQHDYHGM